MCTSCEAGAAVAEIDGVAFDVGSARVGHFAAAASDGPDLATACAIGSAASSPSLAHGGASMRCIAPGSEGSCRRRRTGRRGRRDRALTPDALNDGGASCVALAGRQLCLEIPQARRRGGGPQRGRGHVRPRPLGRRQGFGWSGDGSRPRVRDGRGPPDCQFEKVPPTPRKAILWCCGPVFRPDTVSADRCCGTACRWDLRPRNALDFAGTARSRFGPAAQRPSGPAAQRPSGPAAQRPSGPAAQRPSGPAAQRPSGPAAQRPSGPPLARLTPGRPRVRGTVPGPAFAAGAAAPR